MAPQCLAPVFKGTAPVQPPSGNPIRDIIVAIVATIIGAVICVLIVFFGYLAWLFWFLLSPFSASARCRRKQTMFRIHHCIDGNNDPNIAL